jgi:hypothetical protein
VLGEKEFNLVEQTIKLLATEGLSVTFTGRLCKDPIKKLIIIK